MKASGEEALQHHGEFPADFPQGCREELAGRARSRLSVHADATGGRGDQPDPGPVHNNILVCQQGLVGPGFQAYREGSIPC